MQATNSAGEYASVGSFNLYADKTVSVTLNGTSYAGNFTQTTTTGAIDKTISVADGAVTFTAKKLTANIYDILGTAEGKKYYHHNEDNYVQLFNTAKNVEDYHLAAYHTDYVNRDTNVLAYKVIEITEDFGVIFFFA